ncbi:MAG: glycoside hydrolase family 127 protein [Cytophagales bacterium]|nr:glycoside hydrolase family 127 protein [Cytophagales bacterium]
MKHSILIVASAILFVSSCLAQTRDFYPVSPVPFAKVELNDSFWKNRAQINKEVTIPIAFQRSEESGRLANFRIAAGLEEGTFPEKRRGFDDSDVFKIIEGASYSLITNPDKEMELFLDTLISHIAGAQEDDGYLYTVRSIMGEGTHRDTKEARWMAVEKGSHELYNLGHMYEAAVAHYEATGKRSFLNVAIKSADLVDNTFGTGKLELIPGHQEIEIGLVKLYVCTGEERYLNLAKYFLDMRGKTLRRQEYDQTHKPVVEQDEAVGHAVRAIYMFAGMADIAALTGNDAYLNAMEKLWYDIAAHKLYITGGIGSPGGAEGFAEKYRLANYTAYCETCAAIANIFWNYRMFLTHGDSKYIDILELALYNNVLSGVALSGDLFFYPNKLESRGDVERSQWFHTSCCPTNISRIIPSVPGYIYAKKDEDIYINLFISSAAALEIDGKNIEIEQQSSLPWGGKVKVELFPEKATEFKLRVRIPSWIKDKPVATDLYSYVDRKNQKPTILLNGDKIDFEIEQGYAVISKQWNKGDKIEIEFPFDVRKIVSSENVKDNIGRAALQIGPVIYCVEGHEHPNRKANNLLLAEAPFQVEFQKDLLDGVMTIHGKAFQLYENEDGEIQMQDVNLTAIPYYGWANRGASEMLVWLPIKKEYARAAPQSTIASKSKIETSKQARTGGLKYVNDLYIPGKTKSTAIPNFNWWPVKESKEWITYTFEQATEISESSVYWHESTAGEGSYPKSWKLYYQKDGKWKPVKAKYPVEKDGLASTATFKPLKTEALKLEIEIGKDPAGIYEWTVD